MVIRRTDYGLLRTAARYLAAWLLVVADHSRVQSLCRSVVPSMLLGFCPFHTSPLAFLPSCPPSTSLAPRADIRTTSEYLWPRVHLSARSPFSPLELQATRLLDLSIG